VTAEVTHDQTARLADALYRVRGAAMDQRAAEGLTPGHILAVADAGREDLIAAAAHGAQPSAVVSEVRAELDSGDQHIWTILANAAINPLWWEPGQLQGDRIEITWANGVREAHAGVAIVSEDSDLLQLEFGEDGNIVFPETRKRIGTWRLTAN
jgi:hypothetical protein